MKPLVMVSTRGRERCDTRREDVEVEDDLGAYTIKRSITPKKIDTPCMVFLLKSMSPKG